MKMGNKRAGMGAGARKEGGAGVKMAAPFGKGGRMPKQPMMPSDNDGDEMGMKRGGKVKATAKGKPKGKVKAMKRGGLC